MDIPIPNDPSKIFQDAKKRLDPVMDQLVCLKDKSTVKILWNGILDSYLTGGN